MAITVVANPATLTWTNFTVVPNQIPDPNDGTLVDALTRFNFNFPALAPRTIGTQVALADPNVITITPNAQVWSGVLQTAALLSHEQLHYDVGIVTARALAKEFMALRAPNMAALTTLVQNAARLHFFTRAGLLQSRYDKDTGHGTIAHFQKIWKDRMAACLGNPRADQLGGFWL
jgi:hypothetical protein